MDGSASPPADPDPASLRPLLQAYFSDADADLAPLRTALCAVFCTSAEAGIPVERALAGVNAEIDRVVPAGAAGSTAVRALKRLVMMCCLDCYYPQEPSRNSERVSA